MAIKRGRHRPPILLAMKRGPLQLFRRRTLRGLAGFVVAFLVAGHALAATGLCMVTSQEAPAAVHEAGAACADHGPAGSPGGSSGVKHHCPADEPTPQGRSVDLPAPQPIALVASLGFQRVDAAAERLVQAIPAHAVPPPQLYARLQRLRL